MEVPSSMFIGTCGAAAGRHSCANHLRIMILWTWLRFLWWSHTAVSSAPVKSLKQRSHDHLLIHHLGTGSSCVCAHRCLIMGTPTPYLLAEMLLDSTHQVHAWRMWPNLVLWRMDSSAWSTLVKVIPYGIPSHIPGCNACDTCGAHCCRADRN